MTQPHQYNAEQRRPRPRPRLVKRHCRVRDANTPRPRARNQCCRPKWDGVAAERLLPRGVAAEMRSPSALDAPVDVGAAGELPCAAARIRLPARRRAEELQLP